MGTTESQLITPEPVVKKRDPAIIYATNDMGHFTLQNGYNYGMISDANMALYKIIWNNKHVVQINHKDGTRSYRSPYKRQTYVIGNKYVVVDFTELF
jgi:hypothetical protein